MRSNEIHYGEYTVMRCFCISQYGENRKMQGYNPYAKKQTAQKPVLILPIALRVFIIYINVCIYELYKYVLSACNLERFKATTHITQTHNANSMLSRHDREGWRWGTRKTQAELSCVVNAPFLPYCLYTIGSSCLGLGKTCANVSVSAWRSIYIKITPDTSTYIYYPNAHFNRYRSLYFLLFPFLLFRIVEQYNIEQPAQHRSCWSINVMALNYVKIEHLI